MGGLPFGPASAKTPRLVGGVHRDVSGRATEPLRFYLTIDRGLKSGQLDTITVDERQILRLISEGVQALIMLRNE
jgi:LytS/YehU family sensor histidine kinase